MSEAVSSESPAGVELPKSGTFYSRRQVIELTDEINSLERTLSDPKARIEDRGLLNRQIRSARSELERYAPPKTTPQQRDRLAKRAAELLEAIRQDMPSKEEMRRNPPGAVSKHLEYERKHKGNITEWRNIMRTLEPENEDPDLCNLEKYRTNPSTLNLDNAQIPGREYFLSPNTPAYREGWDRTFGGGAAEPSDVSALLARLDELEKKLASQTNGASAPAKVAPTVETRCGAMVKNKNGKRLHELHCKKCKQDEAA